MIRLTGLWKKRNKKGTVFLEGPLGNGKVYVFPTLNKGGRSPDFILYVAEKPQEVEVEETLVDTDTRPN